MGGNIFENTRRVNKEELNNILSELHYLFAPFDVEYHPLRSYFNKNDFGDVDILIKRKNNKNLIEKYYDWLKALSDSDTMPEFKGVSQNSSILSFNYKDFQIDLIFVKPKNWEISKVFYSDNDLGNLMGKIARFFHLKYGFQGLRYNAYSDLYDQKLFEIVLTKDPRTIFEFLGFDYDRYLEGFNNKKDIFEFVINSKYFSKNIFYAEQLTADQKQRDAKRETYQEFMNYIESRNDLPEYQERPSKEEIIKILDARNDFDKSVFNSIQEGLELEEKHIKNKKEARNKFNGNVIMEHFPLSGKLLGKAKDYFYQEFENHWKYYDYLLNNDQSTILRDFEKTCKRHGLL